MPIVTGATLRSSRPFQKDRHDIDGKLSSVEVQKTAILVRNVLRTPIKTRS